MTPSTLPGRVVIVRQHVPPDAGEDEQDVLNETVQVREALSSFGVKVKVVEVGLNFDRVLEDIDEFKPDVVFNLIESLDGTGRLHHLFPAILARRGIPFTGCSSESLGLTSNKPAAKALMRSAGIPTADWALCRDLPPTGPEFDPPYIVKPLYEHASVDLFESSVCHTRDALSRLVSGIPAPRKPLFFIERFIDGREFNLSMLARPEGPEVLPPAEIDFSNFAPGKPRIVDYRAKWDKSSFEYYNTDRFFELKEGDHGLTHELSRLALECWKVFELTGYVRVDFRVDAAGRPFVLEVNGNPCIAVDGGFAAAVARAGLSYPDGVRRIIDDAVQRN
ncbi:MAG: D-alanine--D-alanine ligase [Fibrobacterota bacterium]